MEPADPAVEPLGVLADHDHVDVVLGVRRHERLHAGVPDHRPEVHELVELEADPEQEVALEDPRRHARVAHRAQQDRVGVPEGLEVRVREGLPGPQVPVGAEVEVDQLHLEAVADRLEDLEGLGDHLRPGSVAPDHADPVRAGSGVEPVGRASVATAAVTA